MYPSPIVRRLHVLSHLSRCLFGLLLGSIFLGNPPSVAAQTCAEDSTAVNNRGSALAGDCTTLLGLKDTLRGTASLNWATTLNMDSWDGLTVAGTPDRVTKLELSGQSLTGSLPTGLNSLTGLTTLDLGNNQLSGSIPALSALTNLTTLSLNNNELSGSIPALSALTNLTYLHLGGNQLSGTIPNLSALTNLTELHLYDNQLSGSIPALSALTNLTQLWLYDNQLTGTLPTELSNLTSLTAISLWGNQLTGAIPDLSSLTNLRVFTLGGNPLTAGPIPSWVPSLTNLRDLHLPATNRTGAIPDLSALTKLEYLTLGNNNFDSGAIPSWVSKLTNLVRVSLNNANRTGAIPDLSALTNLRELYLGNNNFTAGAIPSWVSKLTNLTRLYLNSTNRTGAIPSQLGKLTNLTRLYLNDNQLSGSIPNLSALTNLGSLSLGFNQLRGPIPDLSALTSLTHLDLSYNQLRGTIPNLSALTNLTYLDLGGHWESLTAGPIPTWVNSLTNLTYLSLYSTNRTGSIPALSALTSLTYLDLGGNHLRGSIPALSALTSLTYLDLSYNQLSGSIPDLSALTSLTYLDLSYNQLSGTIPALSALTYYLNLSDNQLSSSIPDLSALTDLTYLDLTNNDLSGSIPDLSSLTSLSSLDLANNDLSGSIPVLSALTNLLGLDLASNQLSGSIPALSALTNLQVLNLSDNQLSGSIPDLSALNKLRWLVLGDNAFDTGTFPTLHADVGSTLVHLDLSNTNRTGTFPTLSSYTNLWHLDLSNNAFDAAAIPDLSALTSMWHLNLRNTNRTGSIPTTLGQLTNLEYLDLSENSLTGSIPSQLGSLTGLDYLNLSENALTGNIPSQLGKLRYLTHLYLNNNQLTGNLPSGLNRSSLIVRLGSNISTFGRSKAISITSTADTVNSAFATFGGSGCGTVLDVTKFPTSPTLREALIYANHTSAAETITFAQSLSGQTITLDYDGTDNDSETDPLPALCGGSLTLDGDVDDNGSSDITLDFGTVDTPAGLDIRSSNNTINGLTLIHIQDTGIVVWHTDDFSRTVANNTITNNTVTGGWHGLVVQAGAGSTVGAVSHTTVRDNTISDTSSIGIAVFTPSAGSTITTTTVEGNEVYVTQSFNGGEYGIAAWSEGVNTARVNSITTLKIRDNHVYDYRSGIGIRVVAGFCGGQNNRVEAEISGNTLSRNGEHDSSDITAMAGSSSHGYGVNSECYTAPSTTHNHLDITITDNVSEDTPGPGIAVYGGDTNSDSNTVTATVARNEVWRSGQGGQAGISVSGGVNNADSNTVTATLNDNLIARTTALESDPAGHGLVLVAADPDSTSSDNTLTVNGRGNIISIARDPSETGYYDLYRRQNNDPANQRTGNTLTDNLTGTVFKEGSESNDLQETVTPVNPVTIPANHPQVDDSTFTPASAPVGAGLPSSTQFSAGGQVFNITVLNSSDEAVTDTLTEAVQVCLPIPVGVSASQAYVLRYNPTTNAWERQTAGRTTTGGQVCADITQFSLFTVGKTTGGGGGGAAEPSVVQGFFESPAPGATVSGIDIIRGWSFSEAARIGIEQVALFIDGQRYAVIPCCSTRPDVAQAKPDFPSANAGQSGWGITLNWGNLSAGAHSLQVVATGTDEGRWASDVHTVTVLKPGDIAFADQFSLAEATARLEGSTLLLTGAVLRDARTQTEQEVALRYAWQTGAQGLRLIASRTIEVARARPLGVNRLLAGVLEWGQRWLSPNSVTANDGLEGSWEAPTAGAAVAGIGLIRGWAFPTDTTDEIATVTVQIDAPARKAPRVVPPDPMWWMRSRIKSTPS